MRVRLAVAMVLTLLSSAMRLDAHALEPGFLQIEPASENTWRVTWRKPQVNGLPMKIDAQLPEHCAPRKSPTPRFDGRAYVSGWIAKCDAPIWQGEIFIEGLQQTATDVLVRYSSAPQARVQTFRLTPEDDRLQLPEVPTAFAVLKSYFALGLDHILGGIDHLLFVFALMLLIKGTSRLVWAVTAFTVAHSITLAAAALGWIALPMPPVEAVISLSIVFLATEILADRRQPESLLQRAPWIVAFAFGLLHGLGFASALREIGLPDGDIPVALLSFNLGVEAGQLLFVAAVLALFGLGRRILPAGIAARSLSEGRHLVLMAYAIGSVAAFWTIERVVGFFA